MYSEALRALVTCHVICVLASGSIHRSHFIHGQAFRVRFSHFRPTLDYNSTGTALLVRERGLLLNPLIGQGKELIVCRLVDSRFSLLYHRVVV